MTTHDLHSFMKQATAEMQAEYKRIKSRSTEDPGTAGDEGEENWASLLRNWLPNTFTVTTKGRLINEKGTTSAQCDVIVLAPGYPELLKSKKIYLIGGVVAAFECKNTLKSQHILDAIERCVSIKRLTRTRFGTPYRELHAPIIYGIFSHSHIWRGERAKIVESVTKKLLRADDRLVQHPRECIDLLCISDLGTWSRFTMTYMKPEWMPNFERWDESAREKVIALYGNRGSCASGYQESSIARAGQGADYTPIGAMLSHLYGTVAWENNILRNIADYFRITGLAGSSGGNLRKWDAMIFSDRVRARVLSRHLSNDAWDEWSMIF